MLGWGVGVGAAVLPLAIGAAILRYRLYDLDRIISRTLAYGLLTLLLGGGYAAVVLGLGRLLPQGSSLAVAAATLAVAAVVQPARRRVQAAVDRRFNRRRRYDAARTMQAFSARLRQQVDLDTLTVELLGRWSSRRCSRRRRGCGCGSNRRQKRLRPPRPGNAPEDATASTNGPLPALWTSGLGPCRTTVGGDQVRLRSPPQAARTAGPPRMRACRMDQSREALLAAGTLHSPKGGQSAAVFAADWPPEGHDQR